MEKQENYRQDKFLILRADILANTELTDSEKIVYARICSFGKYFESSASCAEILGKTERVVADAKRKLERLGFIRCVTNTGRGKVYVAVYDTEDTPIDNDECNSDIRKNVGQTYEKTYIRPTKKCRSDLRKNVDIVESIEESIEESNCMSPAELATSSLPLEALKLADLLREKILDNQPTARIDKSYRLNWGRDIDKAHRIDGRSWEKLKYAIIYAHEYSDFWNTNIRSGAKLRKHYDRLESEMKQRYMKHGTMIVRAGNDRSGHDELTPPF